MRFLKILCIIFPFYIEAIAQQPSSEGVRFGISEGVDEVLIFFNGAATNNLADSVEFDAIDYSNALYIKHVGFLKKYIPVGKKSMFWLYGKGYVVEENVDSFNKSLLYEKNAIIRIEDYTHDTVYWTLGDKLKLKKGRQILKITNYKTMTFTNRRTDQKDQYTFYKVRIR